MAPRPDTMQWSKVVNADSFWLRLRGLIGRSDGVGLLMRGQSVHGFWMSRRLRVYGIDTGGRVISNHLLGRRRIVRSPGSTWMLEVPLNWPELSVGDKVPLEELT